MGNDGSGWSMSIWPRYIDRTGQDSKRPQKSYPDKTVRLKKRRPPIVKRDQDKFAAALTEAVGGKAAKAYVRRQLRRKAMQQLSDAKKNELALLRQRLSTIEAGNVWESDHPGPYTAEEKAKRISDLKAQIAALEADGALEAPKAKSAPLT